MILFRLALLAGAHRALGIIDSLVRQTAGYLPSEMFLSVGTERKTFLQRVFPPRSIKTYSNPHAAGLPAEDPNKWVSAFTRTATTA
jgi:hypothetical protein